MMAFYTQHKTHCGVLCFVAFSDAVGLAMELQQLLPPLKSLSMMSKRPPVF